MLLGMCTGVMGAWCVGPMCEPCLPLGHEGVGLVSALPELRLHTFCARAVHGVDAVPLSTSTNDEICGARTTGMPVSGARSASGRGMGRRNSRPSCWVSF